MSRCSGARFGALMSVLLMLTSCGVFAPGETGGGSASIPDPSPIVSEEVDVSQQTPENPVSEPDLPVEEITPPAVSVPEEQIDPPAVSVPEEQADGVIAPVYDFSLPVPEREGVDNSYFEDAAFVGDSRTDGFLIYSGIGCGENLTSNGLSIFELAEKKAIKREGVSYTLLEVLSQKQYGKVYLSLGVNELGTYNDEGFYRAYCNAIDAIRASQPNAVIYIQGLIPLNEDVIRTANGASYLKNDHLLIYNDLMKKAAQEKQVAFLDLNPQFTDETGQLPADASRDGVHLRSDYCRRWLEYLKTHTVDFETLYPDTEVTEG